jgi:hypothetical protein
MNNYVVFKFRSINKNLIKSLVNGEVFFARPSCLNDPFDCQVDVLRSLENAITMCHPEVRVNLVKLRQMRGFLEKVQSDLHDIGVCAFSLELNNPLMWSHYANGHRGLCLTYSFPDSYFYENVDRILGIAQVEYGVSPLTDWFIGSAPDLCSFQDFGITLVQKLLTVKAISWKYEQEVRILRRTSGVEHLDHKFLRQVCFGLETSESDVALVRRIVEQEQYDVTLCRMVRRRGIDFGLESEEI